MGKAQRILSTYKDLFVPTPFCYRKVHNPQLKFADNPLGLLFVTKKTSTYE